MNNENKAVIGSSRTIVICSAEAVRAYQWGMGFTKLIDGDFAELKDFSDWKAIAAAQKESGGKPLVLFAKDPDYISSEVATKSLKLVLVETLSECVQRELLEGAAFTAERRDQWVNETRCILNFFQRNRATPGVLLTSEDVQKRPADCLEALSGIGVELEEIPALNITDGDPLMKLLANLLVERQTHCRNLYEEVLAASSLVREDQEFHADVETESEAIASYLHKQAEAERNQTMLTKALEDSQTELELTHLQIHQLQEELETLHLQVTTKTAEQEEQAKKDSESSENELRAELELALLQIHQQQEELETLHLQVATKAAEQEEQPKKGSESSENELRAELEVALLQIHQLQDELEIYYRKYLEESSKPLEIFGKIGEAVGGETLKILRLARSLQNSAAQA